jgi:hypothetical protein
MMFLAGVAQVEKTTKYNISASLKYRKVAFQVSMKLLKNSFYFASFA